MKEFGITRKQYKDIKKMDHITMDRFLQNLVSDYYEEGKKAAAGLNEEETRAAVLTVKGIGAVKADAIVAALKGAEANKEK